MKSNVKLSQLQLYDHIDQTVGVMNFDEKMSYKGIVYVFITPDSMKKWLDFNKAELDGIKTTFFSDRIGLSLNYVINNSDIEGITFVGLAPAPLTLSRADLLPMRDFVESFTIMHAVITNQLSRQHAAKRMAKKEVYFLGTLPSDESPDFEAMTMKRVTPQSVYESVKIFLTEEHAKRYNEKKMSVSKCKLSEIATFFKGRANYLIEPHCNYCNEYSYKDILGIK